MKFGVVGPLLLTVLLLLQGYSDSLLLEKGKAELFTGRCSLFGDDHIQTFDGTFYDFPGDCSYLLAGDCEKRAFTLLGDYQHGKKKSVSLYLGEYIDIHLSIDGTVTRGEKRIHLPYASNSIFIEPEAGHIKLSSEEYGFMVRIDTVGNIQIFLSSDHVNKTCGLCGNFNSLSEDEFMSQEEFLVTNSYDFANSWAIHGTMKRCKRVSPPSKTCNVSSDLTGEDFVAHCQLLMTSSEFFKCHHHVDPEPFIVLCESDMCRCGDTKECHCQAFLEYARTCAQHGYILRDWTKQSACGVACPAGMEYSECVSPCTKTCQSLNINEVCDERCMDGCRCPEGKVLDGDHCVDISACSCVHNGKRYEPGSSISRDCNSCICRHGLWVCSNEDCPGECFISGQSHFKSFDNKHFTFSGVCHYLFAKETEDNSFAVTIETVQCADDKDAVCIKSASVRLQDLDNMIIKLKHGGGVAVDGHDIQTPMIQGALRIQHLLTSSIRLIYNNDIQIDWNGQGTLILKLSPIYKGLTSGLCGNYNGNKGDDFETPSGLVEVQVEDFGNAWKLSGECLDVIKQDLDPCSLNPKRARYAEDACSVLMSSEFEVCHHEVSPFPYLKNCRYDVCACSDSKECLCSSISTYAMACARKGVVVNWRTPDFCAMYCPAGEEYRQCGSPCNQTCRSLSFPDTECSEFCMEGCYCPHGLYRLETGECVPKADCSCYYDGEIFQPNDLFSNHFTMCYCENGVMHCSSNDVPGAYLPELYTRPSARGKRSLACTPPFEKYTCPEDNPRAVGTECAKTCKNYRLECISHGCISGCMCPTGLVRHENQCIRQDKCPCFHNGREYSQGEKINIDCNTCVCHKWKWDCTNKICDGRCTAIGEAHYLTFDKMKYVFPGPCQYVLVQDYCHNQEGTFRILVENEGCGYPGEKCVKRILVLYRKGEIELADEKVVVLKRLQDDTDVETIQSGRYYILLLGNGVSITWDKAAMVTVHLKGKYRNKVCGLCGDFDGVQNNDLMSSQNQLQAVPSDFGNSWKVHAQCADAELATPPCADNMMKQMQVENACNILRSDTFKKCKGVVNPEPYWDICVYDTCACESIGDCACFCDALAAYAYECAQQGAPVEWRSSSLCPLSCEEKNHIEPDYKCEWRYNTCASACPVTCQHPEPLGCIVKCVEGCHANCPAGKILDEIAQQCVDAEHCSVCVINGKKIPLGKKIYQNRDDPRLCRSCVCNNTVLSCSPCLSEEITTPLPQTTAAAPTVETTEEPLPEDACSRMMDLVFIVDGSFKMSENDFEMVKDFIVAIMQHFHIDQSRIRVAAMQYSADLIRGSTSQYKSYITDIFKLNNNKRPSQLRQLIRGMKYIGAAGSDIGEALKFVSVQIFNRARRFNAPKVVVLLTASASVRDIQSSFSYSSKQKIVLLSLGIGPNINKKQLDLLTDRSLRRSKAIYLDSAEELTNQVSELDQYLCDLGESLESKVTRVPILATRSTIPSMTAVSEKSFYPTTMPPATSITIEKQIIDMVIVIEGSKNVGKEEFEENKKFIEQVVDNLDVGEETVHITIIQYSYTVTVEYSFTDTQTKEEIIKTIRQMEFQSGNATNTGKALNYVKETTLSTPESTRDRVPKLVFLVASNPSTDVIQRPPDTINIIPIATSPNVTVKELELIGKPILLNRSDISETIQNVVKKVNIVSESSTLHKEISCKKPMDLIFLLDGSSMVTPEDFEEMKNFVKSFIRGADIGPNATQVAVLQYGHTNSLEITWTDTQTPESLLKMMESIQPEQTGANHIGSGLMFTTQTAASEAHGGRPGIPKIAVVIVMNPSADPVAEPASAASKEGLLVFPIAIGDKYDENELVTLAGQSNRGNIIKLSNIQDLPTMVSLKKDFIDKLCRASSKVCRDDAGNERKLMETWIPANNPCEICMCLENRGVNCTTKPCATAAPSICGECEIPQLRKTADQCCSEYECVCDLDSCNIPPIPHCEDGLSSVLLNPGECKSKYGCACKRETCSLQTPLCPHYKTLQTVKTQCCDKYECVCNCINSTVNCPSGYQSVSTTNDCGCITTRCIPEKVCVRQDVTYHVGRSWEENCKQCKCTDQEDVVTGLYIAECIQKQCIETCPVGYTYTKQEGLCCGKCIKSACQEEASGRGDDIFGHTTLHAVGDVWKSPSNPCVINECIQVNGESFVRQSNVSCSELHTSKCPLGFELQCNRISECCPSCECTPVHGCPMNGTIFGVGETVLVDECSKCQCNMDASISRFRLMCEKTFCPPCPEGYKVQKINGSCCGSCAPSVCTVKLTDGRSVALQPNTSIKDGCKKHTCKTSEKGGLVWEQMIQECQQFDRVKCLEEGGKVVPIGDTCCETCIEAECRQTMGIIRHVKIDDCITENPTDINYCEGKCTTKSIYSLEQDKIEDQCICCSAVVTEPKTVSLRCANGTMVQHQILNAVACECLSHRCENDFGQTHI